MLGITPPTDRDGVLQDIHWAAGWSAIFRPTRSAISTRRSSSTRPIATWADWPRSSPAANLRRCGIGCGAKSITVGRCYTAAELVERVTGKPLSHEPLLAHLRGKFGPLYGI